MGLLSKANLLEQNKRLAFSNFISKYNISFFAIFELKQNSYEIVNSLGFDGSSILSSVSTVDFWNGVIREENKIYKFSSEDMTNPLFQFFSFKIKDNVHNITAFKTDTNIVLICNNELPETVISDFRNIDYSLKVTDLNKINSFINNDSFIYRVEFDFQEAVESFLFSKKQKTNNSIGEFTAALFNELSNRVLYNYTLPNSGITFDEFKIKTVFICNSKTSKDLLINHLILNFREVIENSAEIISIDFCGKIENFQKLKDYLQVE